MKIGILGGGFNPPHYGHLLIAQQVLDFLKLDEIWLMPVNIHPFNKELLPADVRFKMAKLLETDKIKVSDHEIKQTKISYTFETLEALASSFPENIFYFIIGEDQLKVFKKWKEWSSLITKYKFIVFPREADVNNLPSIIDSLFEDKNIIKNFIPVNFANIATTNISSSMIRRRIKDGRSIKYLVPEKVEQFIINNKLYE